MRYPRSFPGWLAAVALCSLAGCAELHRAPVFGPAVAVDAVVEEASRLVRAPAAEQKSGLARAQEQFERDPGPVNRLRLATVLAVLPPPLRDDARALELLEPLAEAGAPGPGGFGAFLAMQLTERQRLLREIDRLAKERAALLAAERERQLVDKERDKREEALRQQLEALRAIERGILEREERARQKGKP